MTFSNQNCNIFFLIGIHSVFLELYCPISCIDFFGNLEICHHFFILFYFILFFFHFWMIYDHQNWHKCRFYNRPPKMWSKLCQIWLTIFCYAKSSKFCIVWTIRFCANFTSRWFKYFYQIMCTETEDFQCQHQQLKYLIAKSIFAVKTLTWC